MDVPFRKSVPWSGSFSSLTAFSWQKVQADSPQVSTTGHVLEREQVILRGYVWSLFPLTSFRGHAINCCSDMGSGKALTL